MDLRYCNAEGEWFVKDGMLWIDVFPFVGVAELSIKGPLLNILIIIAGGNDLKLNVH